MVSLGQFCVYGVCILAYQYISYFVVFSCVCVNCNFFYCLAFSDIYLQRLHNMFYMLCQHENCQTRSGEVKNM